MSDLRLKPTEKSARGLAKAMGQAIRSGQIAAGSKLPPIRSVAEELDLSPATVHSAWAILARSGVVRTDGRRGTTVTDVYSGSTRYTRALEREQTFSIDLSSGTPDLKLLPDLHRALTNHSFDALAAGYLDPPTVPALVEKLRTLWPYEAQAFMVADGAMDAIEQATRAQVRFGDRVIVEDPGFPLLIDGLESNGAEVVGIKVDDQGMLAKPLAEALSHPAAAVYLQPRAQNPTGVSLSPARARELAGIIGNSSAMVIEDDSAGAIASTPEISLGSWLPEKTIHIRSFSKSHGPDLRLAAMSGPADVIREITARRQLGQGWTSRLLQHILLTLLSDSEATRCVEHARDAYRFRREAIIRELKEHGIRIGAADGFNIWIPVANETGALVRLASQGIGVAPGAPFILADNQGDHIRATISSVEKDHKELAAIIADAATAMPQSMGR